MTSPSIWNKTSGLLLGSSAYLMDQLATLSLICMDQVELQNLIHWIILMDMDCFLFNSLNASIANWSHSIEHKESF